MKRLKQVGVLLVFLISSVGALALGAGAAGGENLTITKDIEFEVVISSGAILDLDPVYINFGNIVRNSKDTVTKTEYLKFKTAFDQDNKVTADFPEGDLSKDDMNYAKFNLDYENKQGEQYKDTLPVHIRRIEDMLVLKGEQQIPITAEIREVPENQRLGKYYKEIKMEVTTTPVNPIVSIRKPGQGGMR